MEATAVIYADVIAAVGSVAVSLALGPMLLDKRTSIPLLTSATKVFGYSLVVTGLFLGGLYISAAVCFTLLTSWTFLFLFRRAQRVIK